MTHRPLRAPGGPNRDNRSHPHELTKSSRTSTLDPVRKHPTNHQPDPRPVPPVAGGVSDALCKWRDLRVHG